MDSKGNMTIELGLILVIILLITGIILSFTEMANEKIVKQEEMEHVETLIERTARLSPFLVRAEPAITAARLRNITTDEIPAETLATQ